MSNKNSVPLLTPIGRLVEGSVHEANTTDASGRPLVVKSGPNAGQPKVEYYFALAIPKGGEQGWWETEWGQTIFQAASAGFHNGETNRPDFAWKIVDGDSQVPNQAGTVPSSKVGFPGHWVLRFTSGFAPSLHKLTDSETQTVDLPPNEQIVRGYYVQVYGSVVPNGDLQKPGVFLNHSMVCLRAYGEAITSGPSADSVGFGGGQLPQGAMQSPAHQPGPQGYPPQPAPGPQGYPQQPAPGPQGYPQQPAPGPQGYPVPNAGPAAAAPAATPTGPAPGVPSAAPAAGPGPQYQTPQGQQFLNGPGGQ